MDRKLLSADEIAEGLKELDGWLLVEAVLSRQYVFTDFANALAFVNQVAQVAEQLDHHPDITFGWGYAEIITTTHDRGGVTDFDLELARRIDAATTRGD